MGPDRHVIKDRGENADTGSSACLALETVSQQWMEGEKELSMRTSRSITPFATCMELPGLPVGRDS